MDLEIGSGRLIRQDKHEQPMSFRRQFLNKVAEITDRLDPEAIDRGDFLARGDTLAARPGIRCARWRQRG